MLTPEHIAQLVVLVAGTVAFFVWVWML